MTLAVAARLLLLALAASLSGAVEVTSSSGTNLLRAEPPAVPSAAATAAAAAAASPRKVEVQVQAKGQVSEKQGSVTSVGALFEAQEERQEQEISELKSELKKLQEHVEKPEVTVKLQLDELKKPATANEEAKRSSPPAESKPAATLEELAREKATAVVNKDIQYSVYVRKIYDIDVAKKTWEADLVVSLAWYDAQSHAPASPSDAPATYAVDEARKIMWLPDIAITNRHMKDVETVSESVKVWPRRGWVAKVQRVSVRMLNDFDTSAYPFDNQTLKVVLSSTKYMSDEVSLRPHEDPEWFGVKPNSLKGTGFVGMEGSEPNYSYAAINETDGELRKCRGNFYLKVKRSSMATSRTVFEPTLTLVALPYAVLFFPRLLPFSMPRLATSMIPLLCMITFSNKYTMPDSWLDVYFEMVTLLISSMCVWSLVVEVVQHTYKNEELASRMIWELKILYPATALCLFLFLLCFSSGDYNDAATSMVRFILLVEHVCILYFARKRAQPQAEEATEGGDLKDAADASKDPPPVPDSADKPAEEKGADTH
eukprot:TRINITY_DN4479_c0_g1_i1.p1 TRINITY_DN4479_c0_g1~~TRINITY_DN4479_c0_g1_i1.p1  ORF type:complete len:542 (+),score=101.33 TRINITY_DN4479_c0_g1_i1:80-1705(+)